MGPVVLDTSVVLALLDPDDALHSPSAREVTGRRGSAATFVLPASVLAELLVGAANRGDLDKVRQNVVGAFGPVRVLDEAVAVAAAVRRSRHPSLRLPDALVLATADVVGAEAVLTGDRRWGALDERVVVLRGDGA